MTDSTRKIRVVAVDDDPAVLSCVEQFIGLDQRLELVGTGRNGRQALQLANSLRPDVMLLDVRMPYLNGIEAAGRISRAFPSIAVVILTSEDSTDLVKEALRAGVKDYLSKATDLARVGDCIVEAESKRDPLAPARGLATVWAFYACKATAGCTTLSLATACDLASIGFRVLLADFDVEGGDVTMYLRMTHRPPAECVLPGLTEAESATGESLKHAVRKFSSPGKPPIEFDLLESPGRTVRIEPGVEEKVAALLDVVVTAYDYVVLDLPPGALFQPHVTPLLDVAERLFCVTHCNVSSVDRLLKTARTLEETGYSLDKVTVLLSAIAAQPGHDARSILGRELPAVHDIVDVPLDVKGCGLASAKGCPVAIPDPAGILAQFIRQFVDGALNRVPEEGARTDLWSAIRNLLHL